MRKNLLSTHWAEIKNSLSNGRDSPKIDSFNFYGLSVLFRIWSIILFASKYCINTFLLRIRMILPDSTNPTIVCWDGFSPFTMAFVLTLMYEADCISNSALRFLIPSCYQLHQPHNALFEEENRQRRRTKM